MARKDSPMVLGIENGESYIASDVPAILKYTRNIYYIGNLEMARVRKGEITFFDLNGDEIEKTPKTIDWDAEAAEKAGYEHFMMKEIHEQPRAITDTLNSVIKEEVIDLSDIGLTEEAIKGVGRIYIVACGSAYHVGMAAQYVLEDMAGIPVRVELASEFRYRSLLLEPDSLVMIVSQSGETADSLAALREAKKRGRKDAWYSKCSRFLDRKRSGLGILYVSRTGDFRSDDKGVQHAAHRDVCARGTVRKGARKD